MHFVAFNLRVQHLPEGRENNFLIKRPNPKMRSKSGRKEKDKCDTNNGQEKQCPSWGIKQFQQIPGCWNFSWISGEPILRKISKSRSTGCYFSPFVVTTVVTISNNVSLIPLNLIIWLNHSYSIFSSSNLSHTASPPSQFLVIVTSGEVTVQPVLFNVVNWEKFG